MGHQLSYIVFLLKIGDLNYMDMHCFGYYSGLTDIVANCFDCLDFQKYCSANFLHYSNMGLSFDSFNNFVEDRFDFYLKHERFWNLSNQ